MRVLSVNIGRSQEIRWRGKSRTTGICKLPVDGPVWVGPLGLEGDVQVDRRVHGGRHKAVYAYPWAHYGFWREALAEPGLSYGAFGENLTLDGLDEEQLHVGDELQVGGARVVVTQPRLPCATLAMKFQRADMQRRFLRSGRSGFYLAVLEEGAVQAGDPAVVVRVDPRRVRVADLVAYHARKLVERDVLRRATEVEALPETWRDELRSHLAGRRRRSAPPPAG